MEWNNEMVLKFLDLYENEPAIWKPSHPNHKSRTEVFRAWTRIQKNLDCDFSLETLKKKKESLMATFRILRKKATSKGNNDQAKPHWFAYAKMDSFLGEVYANNEAQSLKVEDTDLDSENLSLGSYMKNEFLFADEDDKNRAKSLERRITEAILKASAQAKRVAQKDECEVFADLIATKLKKFDEHTRDFIMHEIDNLIFKVKGSAPPPGLPLPPPTDMPTDADPLINAQNPLVVPKLSSSDIKYCTPEMPTLYYSNEQNSELSFYAQSYNNPDYMNDSYTLHLCS